MVVGTHTAASTGATAVGVVRILANGELDPTFDGDGKATFPVTAGTTVTTGRVAVGATGRIVLTAAERTSSGAVMAVYALGTGGKLDKTFGTQGRAAVLGGAGMTIAGDGSGSVTDGSFVPVTLIASGKILTGAGVCDALPTSGTGSCGVTVVRLTGKGVPDTSFSGDGRAAVLVPVSPAAYSFYDIHALSGGHVLVATGTESTEILARIRPDGTPNSSFGAAGVKTLPQIGLPIASAVQPDGKVLTVSRAEYLFKGEVIFNYSLVRRWTWNGTRDASFGSTHPVPATWVPRYGVTPGNGAAVGVAPHGLAIGTDNTVTSVSGGDAWEGAGVPLFWFDRYEL